MSNVQKLTYDFRLLKPRPGESPEVTAGRDPEGVSTGSLEPQKEALKRRTANELVAANLKLRIDELPYGRIAAFEHIPEEVARRKYRQVELNGPEGGSGLQVVLRDDEALVIVPLWHEGKKAAEVFQEVWRCLELIRRATNYLCYDPQLGRVFEVTAGEVAALECYQQMVRESRQALPTAHDTEEKPEQTALQIRQLTVSAEREVVMVAVRESGVVFGFVDVSIEETPANGTPSTKVASLKGWYVAPAFRGRGIGRQLRDSAKAWAATLGVSGWM